LLPKVNGVEIDDTHIESCEIISSKILVTSITKTIALANAQRLCSGVITFSPIEGILGNFVPSSKTPDGRPGFNVLLRGMRNMNAATEEGRELFETVFTNLLCLTPHMLTAAIFNAVPKEKMLFTTNAGETVRLWGDGFETEDQIKDRKVYRIPVMIGESIIEKSFGVTTSFDGALELMCQNPACALMAVQVASERILDEVEGIFVMYPLGGANGAKIGGTNYKDQKATSTTFFCPNIRKNVSETRVKEGVNSVIEYPIWGLDKETLKKGLKVSLDTITRIPGIIKVSSFNQGGLWGKHKIYLKELLE
jgi:formylmethanofuran--tetrahydromethanopterin N-formyltransferase